MNARSVFVGIATLAATASAPSRANATGLPPGGTLGGCASATYSATLGLGGALTGCFSFSLTELGENAGGVARQFYWNGSFLGAAGVGINAPIVGGTEFFNDDCGSSGAITGPGTTFAFCTDAAHTTPVNGFNGAGEFVMGLLVSQDLISNGGNPYWIYSGDRVRNSFPSPSGFQAVLMQLTTGGTTANPGLGTPIDGEFLFAWEDLKSGCTAEAPTRPYFRFEDLGNAIALDDGWLHKCISFSGPSISDNDFNDSYVRLRIAGVRVETVTPEPMTMTLMATGLVGLAGTSLRRRKKDQG